MQGMYQAADLVTKIHVNKKETKITNVFIKLLFKFVIKWWLTLLYHALILF